MVLTQFGDTQGQGTMFVAPGTDILFFLHLIIIVEEIAFQIPCIGGSGRKLV